MPPRETCRIPLFFSLREMRKTPVTTPKQAKFQAPIGPWMKS